MLEMRAQRGIECTDFCWNYSSADRKPCPAGQRGNYGRLKLDVQQTLYGRQTLFSDGK